MNISRKKAENIGRHVSKDVVSLLVEYQKFFIAFVLIVFGTIFIKHWIYIAFCIFVGWLFLDAFINVMSIFQGAYKKAYPKEVFNPNFSFTGTLIGYIGTVGYLLYVGFGAVSYTLIIVLLYLHQKQTPSPTPVDDIN